MCSACRESRRRDTCLSPSHLVIFTLSVLFLASAARAADQPILRIAADPNNLPFSNDKEEGFENKIAQLIATELGAKIEYTWWAQRRGFYRDTLKKGDCDLVLAAPGKDFERALLTVPYYRSTYVFVTRKDRNLHINSFDDPLLKKLKIGVQLLMGASSTPPAQALARRKIIDNIVGYTVVGDYTQPNPPARIIDAVANGDVDVAVVWGPLGGYFAKRSSIPLDVTPIAAQADDDGVPFAFDICVGVKRSNTELRDRINDVLARRRADVDKILDDFGVPRVARIAEAVVPTAAK